ncbi:putative RNA-directed DNA polymerase, eukaryota, reverse transcriptase zinc-binding domain protein [Tanacetum coccineum]
MFSMGNDKSPGPDGYTAAFFKKAWDIVGDEVVKAVGEFFINGRLLKEINHTIIALIPKVQNPMGVNDYRPISCCIFKCISKILANSIKESLKTLISPNQSAFVPGRSIADNILLTQELMHNYHLDRGVPRCPFKVDIQKAYDKGDPLSSYLFTIVMEVFTLILRRRVRDSDLFSYHRYCSKMELINLCFANDLFLFAYGDTHSILPFEEGRLPVKYLGVPLVSSRLVFRDCKELIEKVEGRINDWKNKSLSIAGRLQLVQSVIASMHVYWALVFILPSRILLEIEQLMRGFLWCQGGLSRGKAKVSWEVVCLPKDEGGLGIRRLDLFNKALMTTHIWKLLSVKESLWVKWIYKYKIRDRNFWKLPCRGNMTWGWRNILQCRPFIREFFKYKIGNGNNVSLWYDNWCSISPLASIMATRYMNRDGLNTSSKVSDVFQNGNVVWPQDLVARYPLLGSVVGSNSVGSINMMEWRDNVGVVKPFLVNAVWQALRPREDKITQLVVAAAAYFIWHERNCRLFKKAKRSEDQAPEAHVSQPMFSPGYYTHAPYGFPTTTSHHTAPQFTPHAPSQATILPQAFQIMTSQGSNFYVPENYAYTPNAFHLQATMLPLAFLTMILQDPAWNMAMGASSHLDNKVSFEFDEFGFSVKDYRTRKVVIAAKTSTLFVISLYVLLQLHYFLLVLQRGIGVSGILVDVMSYRVNYLIIKF